jgi:hypothetical protein
MGKKSRTAAYRWKSFWFEATVAVTDTGSLGSVANV